MVFRLEYPYNLKTKLQCEVSNFPARAMDSETEGKEDHGQDGFTLMLLAMSCSVG
jgi:hypothetical protein